MRRLSDEYDDSTEGSLLIVKVFVLDCPGVCSCRKGLSIGRAIPSTYIVMAGVNHLSPSIIDDQ